MNEILFGDCREIMRRWAEQGVKAQMCVTSPPYFGLRSYLPDDSPDKPLEIGLEETPEQYVARMVEVFRCVRDVLADDGTLWLSLGDSYGAVGGNTYAGFNERWSGTGGAGSKQDSTLVGVTDRKINTGLKPKNLLGIPWRVAFALQADGWVLRQDIIWAKGVSGDAARAGWSGNPMPESVTDRCTKAHEYIFLLSKSPKYYFDHEAIKEPVAASTVARLAQPTLAAQAGSARVHGKTNGNMKAVGDGKSRNKRSVWTVNTKPFKGQHFATFPPALIEPCILAGSRPGDIVLDPFMGSGTTAAVALQHGRQYLGCELNEEYRGLQDARIRGATAAPKLALAHTSLFDTVPNSTAPDQDAA